MKKEQLIKDILYEILDENKGGLTLSEIEEFFEKKNSSIERYKSAMKKVLRYNCDIFSSNTNYTAFKLVKYGNLIDKKGKLTIRGVIYNFLSENEHPKHINEIVVHVLKYKPKTNKDSIRTSLRALLGIRYNYFGNGMYGISSKIYSKEYITVGNGNKDKPFLTLFILITELLNNNEEPLHINKITETLVKLRPLLKRKNIIRIITVNPEKFKIFRNRYYGLASKEYSEEWVEIDKNYKGDTINELAKEYLNNEKLPKHLSEITDHILKERPELHKMSIMLALKKRDGTIFRAFENNFFGLISKTYPIKYKDYNFRTRIHIKKIVSNYLQNEANPKSIYDIYEYLNKNFQYTNIRSIKQYFLTNSENRYIRFENKYWGLASKKYSNDFVEKKDDLKKGSIHQLAYDYLNEQDTPVHKSEISKYILQYKLYSNKHSVYTTLKNYEHKMFRYFKNEYIGIINKEYSKEYVEIIKQNKKKGQ